MKCLQHDIRTPKTEPIVHSETVEDTVKKLGTDFPIVLKSSTGTQTGVGVVVVESLRSLKALVENSVTSIMFRASELNNNGVVAVRYDKYPTAEDKPLLIYNDSREEIDDNYKLYRGIDGI